jgi:hypothetical protein
MYGYGCRAVVEQCKQRVLDGRRRESSVGREGKRRLPGAAKLESRRKLPVVLSPVCRQQQSAAASPVSGSSPSLRPSPSASYLSLPHFACSLIQLSAQSLQPFHTPPTTLCLSSRLHRSRHSTPPTSFKTYAISAERGAVYLLRTFFTRHWNSLEVLRGLSCANDLCWRRSKMGRGRRLAGRTRAAE